MITKTKMSDTATTAEWGFTEDEALMRKLRGQAMELAFDYNLDADDVLQEIYLWLSVRPGLQEKSHGMILGETRSAAWTQLKKESAHQHAEYPQELL